MKKILFMMIMFSFLVYAQRDDKYFDAPFGGGGGYLGGWIMPDMGALNSQLKLTGYPELSTSGIYTSGGGGFAYIGVLPYLRIGGMGFAGSTSEKIDVGNAGSNEAFYSIGGGGVTIEYTMPFIKKVGVSLGAIIGGGGFTIDLYKNRGEVNWNDLQNSNMNKLTLDNSYWFFTPTLNFDIPVYRFINFRAGVSYQIPFAEDWEVDDGVELRNAPSDVNGKALYIQAGLYIGLFSF